MSRLAAQPIQIPDNVTVSLDSGVLTVKGPKGELTRTFRSEVTIAVTDSSVELKSQDETIFTKSLLGTYASHITNMIHGVTEGYEKKLIIEGVGYRASASGKTLTLTVGFSHDVKLEVPGGLEVTVEKSDITVRGIDKEKVGAFASLVRLVKPPEPYKGKGIRYHDEVVRRKQGKKAVA